MWRINCQERQRKATVLRDGEVHVAGTWKWKCGLECGLQAVLVPSGCYNKVTTDGEVSEQQKCVSHILEARSSRSGCGHDPAAVWKCFLVADWSSCFVLTSWKRRGTLWGPFYQTLTPLTRDPLTP